MDTSELKTGTFFFGGLIGFVAGLVVAGVLAIGIYQSTPFRPETSQNAKLEPLKPKVEAKTTGQTGALAKDEKKPEAERIIAPGSHRGGVQGAACPAWSGCCRRWLCAPCNW